MSSIITAGFTLGGIAAGAAEPPLPSARMAHTYSIVARDPVTGDLGVAVQSHWFSVGAVVAWAEPGVGAVATQSIVDVSYGPLGLDLMRAGKSSDEALRALLAGDATPGVRQVAMVDARGRIAAHTGEKCIPAAGHATGDGFSCQANLMRSDAIWPAMARAFQDAKGELALRLLAALDAAEKAGGDIRGHQSAAIKIVRGASSGKPWADTLYDLRVEDSADPLAELRRLVRLQSAYRHAGQGDDFMALGKIDEALGEYAESARIAPEIEELPFWQAVTLAGSGRVDEALPIFRAVFAKNGDYRELLKRLPAAGLFPDDPKLLARVLAP
ncbi:MAG: DUF1028 domain-containing protein [Acidobacteriota bacterium]